MSPGGKFDPLPAGDWVKLSAISHGCNVFFPLTPPWRICGERRTKAALSSTFNKGWIRHPPE